MKRRSLLTATGAGLVLAAPNVNAQAAWPSRPIRVIAPFAPGGSVDTYARITARKMQERLGVNVVVENRTGASGTVGGRYVAGSDPDGHTFCFSASVQTVARLVLRDPGYDPITDLVPVTRVGAGPLLLIMAPQRPQNTLQEVVAAIRQNPNNWIFSTSALGAAGHLATIEFIRQVGVDLTIATYRGTTPALVDLVSDRVQLHFDPMLATLPPTRDGRVKAIAITSPQRSRAAPNVPTTAEQGMPSVDLQSWWGLWGPRGTPAEIIARIEQELSTAMLEPDVLQAVEPLGIVPLFQNSADFARFIQADFDRTAELLRIANFRPEG